MFVHTILHSYRANATAEELGITELISERTTYFYGSSDARKSNIARSASNFFGIVIAPEAIPNLQVSVDYFGSSSVEGFAPAATLVAAFSRLKTGETYRVEWYTTVLGGVTEEKPLIMPRWKRPR